MVVPCLGDWLLRPVKPPRTSRLCGHGHSGSLLQLHVSSAARGGKDLVSRVFLELLWGLIGIQHVLIGFSVRFPVIPGTVVLRRLLADQSCFGCYCFDRLHHLTREGPGLLAFGTPS